MQIQDLTVELHFRKAIVSAADPVLVYGGEETRVQNGTHAVNLACLDSTLNQLFST